MISIPEFTLDLALIGDDELDHLIDWFTRVVADMEGDKPEIELLFTEFVDLLKAEVVLREAGLRSESVATLDLLNYLLALDLGQILGLRSLFGEMSFSLHDRQHFGAAVLKTINDFLVALPDDRTDV